MPSRQPIPDLRVIHQALFDSAVASFPVVRLLQAIRDEELDCPEPVPGQGRKAVVEDIDETVVEGEEDLFGAGFGTRHVIVRRRGETGLGQLAELLLEQAFAT